MEKYRLITALLLASVLGLTACGGGKDPSPGPGSAAEETEAEEAPEGEEEALFPELTEFSVHDIYGNEVDQTVFAGKELTMVNIWGTFCPPCKREMPDLGRLNAAYDPQRFQVVGIVCDLLTEDLALDPDMVDLAIEIAEETGADYTHLALEGDLITMFYRFDSVPTTVFVDSEGKQVGTYFVGADTEEGWRKVIDSLLDRDT